MSSSAINSRSSKTYPATFPQDFGADAAQVFFSCDDCQVVVNQPAAHFVCEAALPLRHEFLSRKSARVEQHIAYQGMAVFSRNSYPSLNRHGIHRLRHSSAQNRFLSVGKHFRNAGYCSGASGIVSATKRTADCERRYES